MTIRLIYITSIFMILVLCLVQVHAQQSTGNINSSSAADSSLNAEPVLNSMSPSSLLKHVPSDTLLFSGNAETISLNAFPFVQFNPSMSISAQEPELQGLSSEERFFYEIFLDFNRFMDRAHTMEQHPLMAHYGFSENFSMAIYTVDVMPVIKLTLDEPGKILGILDRAEQVSGFKHQPGHFDGQSYRAYTLGDYQWVVAYNEQRIGNSMAFFNL